MQGRLQKFFPRTGAYPVVHRNLYNVHQRVAASFGRGRVYLAGDSAHVNNPLGGLGLNFGIHDAVELSTLIGRVLRREAPAQTLEQYDRLRRPLNLEYVQQQTVANKKRLEEKDPAARARNNDALRKMAADPAAHRAYLMRASLIDSVRKRTEAAARGTGPAGLNGLQIRGGQASMPAKTSLRMTACTPQFPSTTWVTPKSTATDISEIASSSVSFLVVIRK